MGVQLTNDSNDWVIKFAERDFKKQRGLIRVARPKDADGLDME